MVFWSSTWSQARSCRYKIKKLTRLSSTPFTVFATSAGFSESDLATTSSNWTSRVSNWAAKPDIRCSNSAFFSPHFCRTSCKMAKKHCCNSSRSPFIESYFCFKISYSHPRFFCFSLDCFSFDLAIFRARASRSWWSFALERSLFSLPSRLTSCSSSFDFSFSSLFERSIWHSRFRKSSIRSYRRRDGGYT